MNLVWVHIIKNMGLTTVKYGHLPTHRCHSMPTVKRERERERWVYIHLFCVHILWLFSFSVEQYGQFQIHLGGLEDSGLVFTVLGLAFSPLCGPTCRFFSDPLPAALIEVKMPGPFIPVLDPSSAAEWEMIGALAWTSLNLFGCLWWAKGEENWAPRVGNWRLGPKLAGIERSHFKPPGSFLLFTPGCSTKDVEACLNGCALINASSLLHRLCLSPPTPFRSIWYYFLDGKSQSVR